MNPVTLPPSPNWCLDNILVCANDGTVAWGAKDTIVIANPSNEDELIISYRYITNAHKDRLTSLAFSPEYGKDNNQFLLSSGDDNEVKIWDLKDLTNVYVNSALNTSQKIVAVDWFKKDAKGICYLSNDGYLVYWNILFFQHSIFNLKNGTANCLACCPHNEFTAAVGFKSGLVCVFDVRRSGEIVYKLRSHDLPIVSLSWCPVAENVFNESANPDLLLASAAKDRTIYIWKAGGDGRHEAFITVPAQVLDNSMHRTKMSCNDNDFSSANRNWIALNWVEPRRLLSSSAWGELISWNLSLVKTKQTAYEVVHAHHGRGLFCIATEPIDVKAEEQNWRTRQNIKVWTLAQDRQVICCEIQQDTNKLKYMITTQGGFLYCMAACPLDTSQIAFGAGDRMLRLWNLSEPHKNIINVTVIWKKIIERIHVIVWHPEKENVLAFGTENGLVGLIDTNNTAKPPVLFKKYHKRTVYSLCWGPTPDKSTFHLYSGGVAELVYYDPDNPNKDPVVIKLKDSTDFSWKPNYSCLVVGFNDGSIKFFNKKHKELSKAIPILSKTIFCLVWHPESTASDAAMSPMQNYLAVAGESTVVTILDVYSIPEDSTCESNGDKSDELSTSLCYKTVATLHGHNEKVVTVAWNPFITGQLLTGSYDKTIQIWKVETQEIMKTFDGHNGPVICCMWSPLDPDYVLSGAMDFTLRIWRVSDQQVKLPSKKSKKSKSKKSKSKLTQQVQISTVTLVENVKEDIDVVSNASSQDTVTTKGNKKSKSSKNEYFELYRKSMQNSESFINSVKSMLKKKHVKEGEESEQKENIKGNDDEDESVEEAEVDGIGDDEKPTIFNDKKMTLDIIDKEINALKQKDSHKQVMELEIWRNNLKSNLQKAIEEKRLNDYLVSLTPSLSFKTWQETCMIYAMQLAANGEYTKAATYMLNINKIHDAVGIYMDAKMYKEAYVLATCRLDSEDPLLKQILKEWAESSIKQGKFEESVQCFVKLGDYASAAKLLNRRQNQLSYLELSVELAIASEDIDLIESQAEETIKKSLLAGNTELAKSLINKLPQMQFREFLIQVCEQIFKIFNKTTLDSKLVNEKLMNESDFGLIEYFEELYDREKLDKFYSESKVRDFSVEINSKNALMVAVSYNLSMAIATNSKEERIKFILTSFGMVSNYELTHCQANKSKILLMSLILTLEKKSLKDTASVFNDRELECSESLRAYLCISMLNWFSKAEDAADYVDTVADTLISYLEDVFHIKTVKFWTVNTKIDKVEGEIASMIGKTKVVDEESENGDKSKLQDLIDKLNEMKLEKKEFTELRICAPNPVVAYCIALEFGTKIVNEDLAMKFKNRVTELWSTLQI